MKPCLQCGNILFGRVDKKFCNDHCRNTYNNNQNRMNFKNIRETNNILIKNHKLLREFLAQEEYSIELKILDAKGFKIEYITGIEKIDDEEFFLVYDIKYTLDGINLKLIS